jgi:hypothetical protein
LVKKRTNFVERKTHSRIWNLELEISHLFQGVILFVGATSAFCYKKVPSNMVKETFWKIFKNKSHILRNKVMKSPRKLSSFDTIILR